MSCAGCYTIAAAVLEDALADFRDKNKKLREDYNDMADDMGVILDSLKDRINALNDIDGDIESVGQLIEEVKAKYNAVKGADIDTFLTKTANDEEGPYTDFINMLEKIINYEKNIHQCGKPDCELECMQEPIFNEGNDYKGCWNQTQVMNAITGMTLDMVLTLLKASTTITTVETQTTKDKLGATLKIQSTVQSSDNQVRLGDTA